jgi:hypothetical protein
MLSKQNAIAVKIGSQIDDWHALLDICEAWHVKPETVLYPMKYKDQISATARAVIVRELHKAGFGPARIARLIPLCTRQIKRMLGH